MARNDNIVLPRGEWTELTNANTTAISVTNLGAHTFYLKATVGSVVPTNRDGSRPLRSGETLAADLTISQLWPGLAGANRVWGIADAGCSVSVSHADG